MPRPTRRPTRLTEDLAQAIYARLAAGDTVEGMCADEAFPSKTNLNRWRRADPAFDARIAAVLAARPLPAHNRGADGYTTERAARVIARLAAGESQISIARDPDMPCVMTILKWARRHPQFAAFRAWALRTPRRPQRRATRWSEAVDEEIYLRLCHGEPLTRICADPHMPDTRTVYGWKKRKPDFAHAFALARQIQREYRADLAMEMVMGARRADEETLRELGRIRRRAGRGAATSGGKSPQTRP